MKVFIVHAHPEPRSFNAALFHAAVETLAGAGHEVRSSDLYAMNFAPASGRANFTTVKDATYFKQQLEEQHASETGGFAPEIEAQIRLLEWCDLMIWQFPLWWFGLPAILKGWVDRVFVIGRTYGGGRVYSTGLFRGKRAMLSLTTGGPEAAYRQGGNHGDIDAILRPIHRGMLHFVGFDVLAPHICYAAGRQDDATRRAMLDAYARRLTTIDAETPIEIGSY